MITRKERLFIYLFILRTLLTLCRGTSGIDIDLQKVDIDQCPLPEGSKEENVFAGSHKCKPRTTRVSFFFFPPSPVVL